MSKDKDREVMEKIVSPKAMKASRMRVLMGKGMKAKKG